jgi:hypothetical protein
MADQNTQAEDALKLLNTLLENPKTRNMTQRLVKEVNPKAYIPELDAAAPVLAELKRSNDRIDALTAQLQKRDTMDDIEKNRSTLRSRGYNDEGIKKIEELMTGRGIADYDAAEALFDKQNPAPAPRQPGYSGSLFMDTGGDDFKKFASNTAAWVEEETARTLDDFRNGRIN